MLGDLGVYTSFDQDHDPVFFSSLSIKLAMLPASMLRDYSTRASSTPSCFLRRTNLLGNLFLNKSLLELIFLLSFLIIIQAILPATMLGYYSMSASLTPSEFFIVVLIYWKSASYRLSLDLSSFGKATNRLAAKLIYFSFFFGPTCTLFDLSMASRLRHDPLGRCVYTSLGGL
jgi:hypothetical protein